MGPVPPPPPRYVTVTPWGTPHGSLWEIAEDVFEDGGRWREIYAANRDLIGDDPSRLRPGTRLRMPPMEIYPAYVRAVAAGLEAEGGEIAQRLEAARNALAAIGDFWGGDRLGTRFARGADGAPGYEVTAAQGMAGIAAVAEFYHAVAGGLRAMAGRDEDTEWDNTARVLSAVPGER
jgi:hypothetical protein